MKSFLRDNWFKLLLIPLIVLLVVGLFINGSKRHGAEDNPKNIISCANQAQLVLDSEIRKSSSMSTNPTVSQENHYSQSLNRCLVKISTIILDKYSNNSYINVDLLDAYESKVIVGCTMLHTSEDQTTMSCTIPASKSNGGVVQNKTWTEGFEIIRNYMES